MSGPDVLQKSSSLSARQKYGNGNCFQQPKDPDLVFRISAAAEFLHLTLEIQDFDCSNPKKTLFDLL